MEKKLPFCPEQPAGKQGEPISTKRYEVIKAKTGGDVDKIIDNPNT
ncbi:MAG: hypothetical protein ACK5RV_04255 [Flavobacterium sp.]|nr:hypothetical protein [Flavobacterium sp.]MCZ8168882.1 hypothetical protein [Flavobacterium sp.]MCZ8297451.1 hypothetical protein [Flavobacterium sp.]